MPPGRILMPAEAPPMSDQDKALSGSIRTKAAPGVVIHGNGRAATRVSRVLGSSGSKRIRGLGRWDDPPAGGTDGPEAWEFGSLKLCPRAQDMVAGRG